MNIMDFILHSSLLILRVIVYIYVMATIKHMRSELMKAHRQADEVHLISGIDGAPVDATEVVICYLALEAVRGSFEALAACEAVKEWAKC